MNEWVLYTVGCAVGVLPAHDLAATHETEHDDKNE